MSPASRGARLPVARKSPLRLATDPVPVVSPAGRHADGLPEGFSLSSVSPEGRRQAMISEFGEWLRTQTNRHGRPFQPETISAYRDAALSATGAGGRGRSRTPAITR